MTASGNDLSAAQLLRKGYDSLATGDRREYFLYLPAGYDTEPDRRWPVILFLHGGGERGDGRDELDYVLLHGPLGEAWIQRRNLPFIIIGPQLPVFGKDDQVRLREGIAKPQRLPVGAPPRRDEERPDQPMLRAASEVPSVYGVTEAWGRDGAPGGWQLCETELLGMVDTTLRDYRADPDRVYLTGLSYGGYGTWHLATAHPDRWAAVAPICGGGNPDLAHRLAKAQLPIWIFQGGRDLVIKAEWIYPLANALEQAGHRTVRLTIHEDLGHDSWSRVYAGEDLYHWFLAHRRST
jgi:predicted peptidase